MTNNEKEFWKLQGKLEVVNKLIETSHGNHNEPITLHYLRVYQDIIQSQIFIQSKNVKAYNHKMYLNQRKKRSSKK